MNEELQKALGEMIGKMNDGIDTASGFIMSELPDVIQQLLTWYGIYYFILFIVGLIIPVLLFLVVKFSINKLPKKPGASGGKSSWAYEVHEYKPLDDSVYETGALITLKLFIGGFATVGVMISLVMVNLEWLQIWLAPKVWLIEYASKLAG